MPVGYALSQKERETIASQLVGIPITVQHANVQERIANIPVMQTLSPALMQKTLDSCGLVIAAWVHENGAVMAIFFINNQCERTIELIKIGQLGSVSLTHVESTGQPVELTLCTIPARPGSIIVLSCADLKDAYAYKASSELHSTNKMETQNTETVGASKTPLETILDGLPNESRLLIQARFTQMMEAVDNARAEKATAEEKMSVLQKMSDVDRKMMQTHLDQFRQAIQKTEGMEAQLNAYGLSVSSDGQDCAMDMLKEADGPIMHTVTNLLKCASASMMAKNSFVPSTPSLKRKAIAVEEQANAVGNTLEGTALERAMAAQFN